MFTVVRSGSDLILTAFICLVLVVCELTIITNLKSLQDVNHTFTIIDLISIATVKYAI